MGLSKHTETGISFGRVAHKILMFKLEHSQVCVREDLLIILDNLFILDVMAINLFTYLVYRFTDGLCCMFLIKA